METEPAPRVACSPNVAEELRDALPAPPAASGAAQRLRGLEPCSAGASRGAAACSGLCMGSAALWRAPSGHQPPAQGHRSLLELALLLEPWEWMGFPWEWTGFPWEWMGFPSPRLSPSLLGDRSGAGQPRPRSAGCAAGRAPPFPAQKEEMQRTGWAGHTAPSELACFDASMLLQGNLDRGPANSFPTTPPSPNGDGAGSKPPGSVAKCQRLRTSLVLARAVVPPLLSARLSLLDALQQWDGSKPVPLPGEQHCGGFHQVWIQLRCGATKIPPWHERTTRLHLPAASPRTWTPPFLSVSSWRPPALRTVPGQEGADGRGSRGRRHCSCLQKALGEQGEQPQPLRCLVGGSMPPGTPQLLGGQAHAVPWQSVIPNPGGDFAVPSPGLAFGAEFYQQQLSKINKRACACQ